MIQVTKDLISQIVYYEPSKTEPQAQILDQETLRYAYRIFSNQHKYSAHVDLFDLATVLKCTGKALFGLAEAKGPDRAMQAISKALKGDELQLKSTIGKRIALLSVVSGENVELEMDELTLMTEYLVKNLSKDTEIIFGHATSKDLNDEVKVMVVTSVN